MALKLLKSGKIIFIEDINNINYEMKADNILSGMNICKCEECNNNLLEIEEDFNNIEEEYVLESLNSLIELEDNYTLRNLFNMLLKYSNLQLIYSDLDYYLDQLQSLPKIGCRDPAIKHIVVERVTDIVPYPWNNRRNKAKYYVSDICELKVYKTNNGYQNIYNFMDNIDLALILDAPMKLNIKYIESDSTILDRDFTLLEFLETWFDTLYIYLSAKQYDGISNMDKFMEKRHKLIEKLKLEENQKES